MCTCSKAKQNYGRKREQVKNVSLSIPPRCSFRYSVGVCYLRFTLAYNLIMYTPFSLLPSTPFFSSLLLYEITRVLLEKRRVQSSGTRLRLVRYAHYANILLDGKDEHFANPDRKSVV